MAGEVNGVPEMEQWRPEMKLWVSTWCSTSHECMTCCYRRDSAPMAWRLLAA